MSLERSESVVTRSALQARAARTRAVVHSRVARARVAIIAGIAATTCGLAVFIQSLAPRTSTPAARTSASVPGSAQPAPSVSSGPGDAVSGGS
jgi:hypothetical protein